MVSQLEQLRIDPIIHYYVYGYVDLFYFLCFFFAARLDLINYIH